MIQEKKQVFMSVIMFCIMLCLTGLLVVEYRFFCDQSKRLIALQEQYQIYSQEACAIIEKYTQEDQIDDQLSLQSYSSALSDTNVDATNVFVNRESRYLQESMVAHLKDQGLESLLNRMQPGELIEYDSETVSDRVFEKPVSQVVKKHENKTVLEKPKKYVRRRAGLSLALPIEKNRFWLSSFFGPRKNPDNSWGFHRGIDMAALKGTPVRAAASGVVVEARYAPGYGNTVVLEHVRKYRTRYAHLDTIGVKVGQKIMRGNVLGTVGDTGLVRKLGKDASHLHFEVSVLGKQVNPLQFF